MIKIVVVWIYIFSGAQASLDLKSAILVWLLRVTINGKKNCNLN